MKKSVWKKLLLWLVVLPVLVFTAIIGIVIVKQESIVQSQLSAINEGFSGKVEIGQSHIAPFQNFPYISLKIDDVRILESKAPNAAVILDVADIYIGFNFWDIAKGNFDIQSLIVEEGLFDIVLHEDGTTNIENALATSSEEVDEQTSESRGGNIHLKEIVLRNLEFHQREEATNLDISTIISYAQGGFKNEDDQVAAHIDTEFILDIIDNGDTTYFNDKHFEFHTDLTYDQNTGILSFEPSGIVMEHGDFELEGRIDTRNEMTVDIEVKGTKPSFDMFIAFAPTELIPVLERYQNAGNIYFNAKVQGSTTGGQLPFIEADFGASEAFLENTAVEKRLDDIGFAGYFTNGANRDLSTMEFGIRDIQAKAERGEFIGTIAVKNFEEPDIQMDLDASFDLQFWKEFLNLETVEKINGNVELHMKFHDIIDLDNPEKALEDLNQAYYAELIVDNFSLTSPDLPAPIDDLDIHMEMDGKKATLDLFNMVLGNSDIKLSGYLSDLPAVVHHKPIPVDAHLDITSGLLDLTQLSSFSEDDSSGFNERISNLRMGFSFKALGNAFTEFDYLPKGEFFIDSLFADLENYPHTLHDFHADILINDEDIRIVDFTGFIDTSDFHFNGYFKDYSFWMQENLNGNAMLDLTLTSDLLRFKDLFAYGGENYVPKDYRHEEIENLDLHVAATIDFQASEPKAISVALDRFSGKMHVHPLRFEEFRGQFTFVDDILTVDGFHGKMGNTLFDMDMRYYLGEGQQSEDSTNIFRLSSNYIDFDELFNFQLESPTEKGAEKTARSTEDVAEHAGAYNIFEIPFTNMLFDVEIGHFIYHRYDLQNIVAKMRTTSNHYIYLDTLYMNAAGGSIAMNGYFNGSDPKHIYLSPNMRFSNVDLDQLLFKFENFGQDAIVSENLHGKLYSDIWGNIRVYPDLVPDLDQSEVHLDAIVLDGRLENYEPMMLFADYFGDKDLTNVRFDTLQNHMDITNGTLSIPTMTIESTLGHLELSGRQDMDFNMDYYFRIPFSVIKEAAKNKIFGAKRDDDGSEDEIIEVDPDKKIRYLNVNIVGTMDDYKIRLRKPKRKK